VKAPPLGPTAVLASWLVRVLSASARIDLDAESAERVQEAGTPTILAYWHEQVFLSVRFLQRQFLARGQPLAVLASRSRDGELVARVASRFHVHVVRGSSSRGGREALRTLHRVVARQRASVIFLPDGPRGPRHEVKPGIVVLSQMSRAPILPMAFVASGCWTLRSWDQLAVPHPRCRVVAVAGEPIAIPRELDDDSREHYRLALASTLADLNDDAARRAAPAIAAPT
jgi:hypothetical protein